MSDNMIKETVEKLLSREVDRDTIVAVEGGSFAKPLWNSVVELGLTKILCPEAQGGIGASWAEAFPLFFQVGKSQAPVPLAEAVMGQFFAATEGLDLPAQAVFALVDGGQAAGLSVSAGSAVPRTVSGTAKSVKWARFAQYFVLETPAGRALVNAHAAGIAITQGKDAAAMPSDTVVFDATPVEAWLQHDFGGLPQALHAVHASVKAAMLTGALEFSLEIAVRYVQDRVQFGKPVGKNQAIQQQLAVLAGEVACSYAATTSAMRDLPGVGETAAPHALFSAAVAKVTASDAVRTGASIAHQVHGAIGFTYEYPLNFATRRLWAWRAEAGGSSDWAAVLGRSFIHGGSENFWPHLTARTLSSVRGVEHV